MINKPPNVFLRLILLFNIYYMCYLSSVTTTTLIEENKLIALKTYQPQYKYWSYQGLINGDKNNAANHYYLRKGFYGDYSISLESKANKGFYWRVKNGLLYLEKNDGSKLFKEESSFIPVPGIKDVNLLSLIPVKYPNYYVRHQGGRMKISQYTSTDLFLCDSTWYVHKI